MATNTPIDTDTDSSESIDTLDTDCGPSFNDLYRSVDLTNIEETFTKVVGFLSGVYEREVDFSTAGNMVSSLSSNWATEVDDVHNSMEQFLIAFEQRKKTGEDVPSASGSSAPVKTTRSKKALFPIDDFDDIIDDEKEIEEINKFYHQPFKNNIWRTRLTLSAEEKRERMARLCPPRKPFQPRPGNTPDHDAFQQLKINDSNGRFVGYKNQYRVTGNLCNYLPREGICISGRCPHNLMQNETMAANITALSALFINAPRISEHVTKLPLVEESLVPVLESNFSSAEQSPVPTVQNDFRPVEDSLTPFLQSDCLSVEKGPVVTLESDFPCNGDTAFTHIKQEFDLITAKNKISFSKSDQSNYALTPESDIRERFLEGGVLTRQQKKRIMLDVKNKEEILGMDATWDEKKPAIFPVLTKPLPKKAKKLASKKLTQSIPDFIMKLIVPDETVADETRHLDEESQSLRSKLSKHQRLEEDSNIDTEASSMVRNNLPSTSAFDESYHIPFSSPLDSSEDLPIPVQVERSMLKLFESLPPILSLERPSSFKKPFDQGMMSQADYDAKMLEVYARVEEWHEMNDKNLQQEEQVAPFDLHEYETVILDKMKSNSVMSFRDICKGVPRSEVHRLFISSLNLVNSKNVKIQRVNLDDTVTDEMVLELISTERHHEKLITGIGKESKKGDGREVEGNRPKGKKGK